MESVSSMFPAWLTTILFGEALCADERDWQLRWTAQCCEEVQEWPGFALGRWMLMKEKSFKGCHCKDTRQRWWLPELYVLLFQSCSVECWAGPPCCPASLTGWGRAGRAGFSGKYSWHWRNSGCPGFHCVFDMTTAACAGSLCLQGWRDPHLVCICSGGHNYI